MAPPEAVQLRPTWEALRALALSPAGGAGAWGAPPRKMPETTAFMPPVRVTLTVTVPPAATLTGTLTQAPWEKSAPRVAVWGPEPSLTVMVSRRPSWSKSRA